MAQNVQYMRGGQSQRACGTRAVVAILKSRASVIGSARPRVVRVESRQPPTQDPQVLRRRGSLAITPGR